MSLADDRYLIFTLGGKRHAFSLSTVAEVEEPCKLWPFPALLPGLAGLMTYQGILVAVVDLAAFLGFSRDRTPERLLVMDTKAAGIAFLVEDVARIAVPEAVSDECPEELVFSDGTARLLDPEAITSELGTLLAQGVCS